MTITYTTPPVDATLGYVTGRWIRSHGSFVEDPDFVAESGEVWIIATTPIIYGDPDPADDGFVGVSPHLTVCTLNESGDLCDPHGNVGVWLIPGTYKVRAKFKNSRWPEFLFPVTTENTEENPVDLLEYSPITEIEGYQMVVSVETAEQAAASAAAAFLSETNAASSETAAGISEINAASSASAAAESETAAGLSETNAASSASAAAESETAAGLSETNAASSASAAAESETAAGLSETNAASSASAASLSETNAAASETAAGLSETNAASSASAAAESETAAGLSETNAASSASAAAESETAAGLSETNAASSASAAAESETAAGLSETNAASSASAASLSETNAAASETAAGLSETNAASSASAASLSETNAAASETAAGLSETNAASSASAASLSETNAAASETAAGLSETNAASSASAASLSETNAAASETAAGLSETNAASSASAASLSETNAAASETAAGLSETNAATAQGAAESARDTAILKAGEASGSADAAALSAQAVEDNLGNMVVDASLVGDDLVLVQNDTDEINVGRVVGPAGITESETEPTDTEILWLDPNEDHDLIQFGTEGASPGDIVTLSPEGEPQWGNLGEPIAAYTHVIPSIKTVTNVDVNTGVWTVPGHGYTNGKNVYFSLLAEDFYSLYRYLPYGIQLKWGPYATRFYVTSATTDSFVLSTTPDGLSPLTLSENPTMDLSKIGITARLYVGSITISGLLPSSSYRVIANLHGPCFLSRLFVYGDNVTAFVDPPGSIQTIQTSSGMVYVGVNESTTSSSYRRVVLNALINSKTKTITIIWAAYHYQDTDPNGLYTVVKGSTVVPIAVTSETMTSVTVSVKGTGYFDPLFQGSRIEVYRA